MPGARETWATHAAAWRDPAAVAAWSEHAAAVDPELLRVRVRGSFWEALAQRQLTLLITREYEHLVLALTVRHDRPRMTHFPLPHPSGIAYDATHGCVHIAATRNPNQLVTLRPVSGVRRRRDVPAVAPEGRPLVPVRTRFLPGCLYLHDLAHIGGRLHGSAVGENAVVRFTDDGAPERVWWPRAIEDPDGPDFSRNYLQLNSIAAGPTVSGSYFSASAEHISRRRPGHRDFPVDGRGVIFSGQSREPVTRGLTRPHSARLRDGHVWVANSGYGTVGICRDGGYEPVVTLPGWTRGIAMADDIAFVGTSRVIPRFRHYAPGLDVDRSRCGVHAVDLERGEIQGSLYWPVGNQIFEIEPVPNSFTGGFVERKSRLGPAHLYYSFAVEGEDP